MKERYSNIDEYISDLQSEIKKNENCANHYYNLGLALLSKQDFSAAEDAFLGAVRHSPHLAEAFVQLGGICLARNDLDGCLRYNEEAANCRAKFAIPWSNIGFVHLQKGEVDKAIKALEKALKWDKNFIQAKSTLASAYFMQGDYDACIKVAQEAVRLQPGFGPAWNNLSLAHFEKGNSAQAVDCANKALECGFDVPEQYLEELKAFRQN